MSSDVVEFKDDKIVIHKKQITDRLAGKITDNDIELSKNLVERNIANRMLLLDIISGKGCQGCSELNNEYFQKCGNRVLPYGNFSSNIMFVGKVPSVSECVSTVTHSDAEGHMLMLILSRMGFNPDNLYFTDFVKCPSKNISVDECLHCAMTYFAKEVYQIQPKAIVFQGISSMNLLYENKILLNPPDKVNYGIIYDSYFVTEERPVKVIGLYDMDVVLKKEGTDLQQCKNVIWHNLTSLVKSIQD